MASASVLTYPAIPQSYAHFGRYHDGATTISPSSSPMLAQAFPRYAGQAPVVGGPYAPQISSGAMAAAQAVGGPSRPPQLASRKTRNAPKRRSFGRGGTSPTEASVDTTRSTTSRPTAKEKFKSNIKKVGQQKDDQYAALDLSLTAE